MSSHQVHTAVAMNWATALLEATGSNTSSAQAEARTLMAHAAEVDLPELALLTRLEADAAARFADLVERRGTGIPVQHLTGLAYFRTVELAVGAGVFIPRPETEVMTGWALDRIRDLSSPVVVELCAGSGAIAKAMAVEAPDARVHTIELDPIAAEYAHTNLAGTGVDLRVGDMADAFTDLDGTVDLVISNPPYIPLEAWESVEQQVRDFDPELALFSGQDGLDAMHVVARVAARLLKPGGIVCAEHAEVQHDAVGQLFVDHGGYTTVRDNLDLTGRWRFVSATRI